MSFNELKSYLLDYINNCYEFNKSNLEYLHNIIEFNKKGKTFRNICIIGDSEMGYHIYINRFDQDICFDTDSENLIYIINDIIKRVGFHE